LQTESNSDVHSYPSEKAKGLAGAVLIHVAFLAMLFLLGFSVPAPTESGEGILVNFGTDETGQGDIEPAPSYEEVTSPPIQTAVRQNPAEETMMTQDVEEAPKKKKEDPEAEKKRIEKAEKDKIIKEQLEAERIAKEQEVIEKNRILAEEKRQSDIMNRTKNALANSKNMGTGTGGEGVTGGTGNQGSLSGSIDSKVRGEGSGLGTSGTGTGDKGISFKLEGRGFRKLPSPKYDYQGEGRVVVDVTVDRQGKVIQATPGTKGSTTLDAYLLKVAKEAALAASFDAKPDAPEVQKGTITYNFILR
jgi:outer membrane biosynthesis protein TonB